MKIRKHKQKLMAHVQTLNLWPKKRGNITVLANARQFERAFGNPNRHAKDFGMLEDMRFVEEPYKPPLLESPGVSYVETDHSVVVPNSNGVEGSIVMASETGPH